MRRLGSDMLAVACIVGGGLVAGGVTLALASGAEAPSFECATTAGADADAVVTLGERAEGVVVVRPDVRVRAMKECMDAEAALHTTEIEVEWVAHQEAEAGPVDRVRDEVDRVRRETDEVRREVDRVKDRIRRTRVIRMDHDAAQLSDEARALAEVVRVEAAEARERAEHERHEVRERIIRELSGEYDHDRRVIRILTGDNGPIVIERRHEDFEEVYEDLEEAFEGMQYRINLEGLEGLEERLELELEGLEDMEFDFDFNFDFDVDELDEDEREKLELELELRMQELTERLSRIGTLANSSGSGSGN